MKNKTAKRRSLPHSERNASIVHMFLTMLNAVKLYHWKTRSYSQHKATDDLYAGMNEHIDKFVEILMGKEETRVFTHGKMIILADVNKKKQFKTSIYQYRDYLIELTRHFNAETDTDLLNVRDEILGDINQFLYLLTLH
jgi:DNA-binding ferritin-like protein